MNVLTPEATMTKEGGSDTSCTAPNYTRKLPAQMETWISGLNIQYLFVSYAQ